MQVSIVALTGFIFIMVFANSLGMLVAGQVLCGIPWGVFQTLTTAYAAEVSQNRRNRKIVKKSENTNFRSALSSFEATSLPMSTSAGVLVSSCLLE
jgi:MFS family permease